jgi:hypothetical protein
MTNSRLQSLRKEIVRESISYEELLELQSLKDEVLEDGDSLLMEWAGIPENVDDRIKNAVSNQLWRYYDIEIDIDEIELINGSSDEYIITGSTEQNKSIAERVKFKSFPSGKVEDLYLHDGNEYIQPTTTPEQQQNR